MTHANGVVTNYTYDAASQLLTLGHQLGATTINSFAYTYDKVGNRKSKADNAGTANYTYDVLNRLTQAVNPLPSNPLETFNYDPVGNRTNSNQNGASTLNQANQLLEDANSTYQYDNNGNQTRKTAKLGGAITTYEYDAENKLVRVVSPTNTANYKYDGLGRRVEKEVIAGTTTVTKYVYDNEDILLELNSSNAIVARYTHGPGIDEPLIMENNSQSFYYHADGLDSITEITNNTGSVAQRYTYSSFGKIESQLDPSFLQPYTFTSREFDAETGLHFYRARYYDANTGRFLEEDPIRFASGDFNFYAYVGSNPVKLLDSFGLSPTVGECLASCASDQIGLSTLLGAGGVVAGLPILPKPFVTPGSSEGTSLASKGLSYLFPQKLPIRVWALTVANPAARTIILGRALGRWIPIVGWGLLAYDAISIGVCVNNCLNADGSSNDLACGS